MNLNTNQGAFTGNTALVTTQVLDAVGNVTGFYVIRWVSSPLVIHLSTPFLFCGELRTYSWHKRQYDASSNAMVMYTLTLPTSIGSLTVPQLGGQLSLDGKDSKVHVVDYIAGSSHLLYSTGEIMTWYVTPLPLFGSALTRTTRSGRLSMVATSLSSTETPASFTKRHSSLAPPLSPAPMSFQERNLSRPKQSIRRVSLFNTRHRDRQS